jgi:copper chaperone CopZ
MKHILTSLLVAILATFLSSSRAFAQTPDSVKTATIKVGNLHCNGDMPTIKKRLLNQDGIDDVAFTDREGEVSTFTVKYHTSVTDEPAIHKAIETTPGCDDKSETPYRVQREHRASKKKGS